MENNLKDILKKVNINEDRYSDKQIHHLGEHIDNAMTELAFAANIIVKLAKHQGESRRKDDLANTTPK